MEESFEKISARIRGDSPSWANFVVTVDKNIGIQNYVHPVYGTLLHVAFASLIESLRKSNFLRHEEGELSKIVDLLIANYPPMDLNTTCMLNGRMLVKKTLRVY